MKLLQVVKRRWVDTACTQKVQQAFSAASTLGQYQHTMWRAPNVRLQFGQRLFCATYHREVGQGLCQGVVSVAVLAVTHIVFGTRAQSQLRMLVGAGIKLLGR